MEILRARLKHLREDVFDLSHEQFARKVDVSTKSIFTWENGAPSGPGLPSLPGLVKLALTCGVSTDWLLGLTDDPTPASGASSDPGASDSTKSDSAASHAARARGAAAGGRTRRPRPRRPS